MDRRRWVVALASVMVLVAPACGTRVDRDAFYEALVRSGSQASAAEESGDVTGGEGTGGSSTTGGGTKVLSSGTAGKAPSGATGAAASSAAPLSGLSSKVVGDVIRVGIHIPITGAAPLPTDFLDYIRVIEEYVAKEAPVNGRTFKWVEVDDGYDPAKGQAACRKIAEEDVLFAVGHTMPAIEDGCAALFTERGVPYLMRGTYPQVLDNRPFSYFGTISDDRQGRLLADYALNRLGARTKNVAIVYQNDQTAARDSFVGRMKEAGASVVVQEQSVPRQPDYGATVQKLEQAGAQIVFLSMPPVDAIKLSVQAQGGGYHPTWLGGATYWNYNMTLESAGMAMDGAIAFSPWASIDSAAAADFKAVYARYRPNRTPDDIGLIIWGWYGLIRTALEKAGPQLSRASFVEALNSLQFQAPYWNPITYTPTDHKGPTSVAVFRADGQAKRWRQVESFTSGF